MNASELAILGLIIEAPRHGYEIEQVIDTRGMREWAEIGFSSIYYLLKKLEKDGLIESRAQAAVGQGPSRKVYAPTTNGIAACREETRVALSAPQPSPSRFMLGLANFPLLPPAEALSALYEYRLELQAQLDRLTERRAAQEASLPPFAAAMFDRTAAMLSAEVSWLDTFIIEMEEANEQG